MDKTWNERKEPKIAQCVEPKGGGEGVFLEIMFIAQ